MPTGENWMNFIYVNLGFIAQVICMYYFTSVVEIKKNWPQYRCNPMYMPLSDDIAGDFTYCVQNTQVNMMGYLLQPLTFLLSNVTSISSEFQNNLNGVRNMFDVVRSFITSIVENIFAVFSNLIIEFQTMTISLKDSMGKIIGIMVSLLYILDGSIKTMNSAWKGPPGQMIQALGSCFESRTKIKMKDGMEINIKNIKAGSILEDGSKVLANMELLNQTNEILYKIKGINNNIFVTGTHFIFCSDSNKFVQVKDFKYAEPTKTKKNIYYCLITDTHKIPIEQFIFWDWEDDILTLPNILNKSIC